MSFYNASITVTAFVIGGFDKTKSPLLVGLIILMIYSLAVLANMVNILIIIYDKKLHKPMYVLICNLAIVDILYTSSASPTMIGILIAGVNTISYVPCYIQMFTYHVAGVMEMFALSIMAFDRLVAISYPFQYHRYLTNVRILVLAYLLWILSCCLVAGFSASLVHLPYCSSTLKYTFCDYPAIMRTTCVDPTYYFGMTTITTFFILFFTFSFICLSYLGIIYFVKISSSSERLKIGSTCVSHLIAVVCYYCPIFITYVLTRIGVVLTLEQRHALVIGTILFPSFVNPFVYCFRTQEMKCKVFRLFKKLYKS